jgi:hypothetical protein
VSANQSLHPAAASWLSGHAVSPAAAEGVGLYQAAHLDAEFARR